MTVRRWWRQGNTPAAENRKLRRMVRKHSSFGRIIDSKRVWFGPHKNRIYKLHATKGWRSQAA